MDMRVFWSEIVIDAQVVFQDSMDFFRTDLIILEQLLHIEDKAFIDAVLIIGTASMDDAVTDEDDIAGNRMDLCFIEAQRQAALQDMYEFIFDMPVIRHAETRMELVDVMELQGEVKAAPLAEFIIAFMK